MTKKSDTSMTLTPELAAIDDIVNDSSLVNIAEAAMGMVRAVSVAMAIRKLTAALDVPKVASIITELAGNPLGFRTDRDGKESYPWPVMRDCAVEAMLKGAQLVGNEFNIISSRAYFTREYFSRMLGTHPGITNLAISPGVPAMKNGGAIVHVDATWNLNGQPMAIARDICVKVNSGMGADAILGKADRKIKAAIWALITGTHYEADGEAGDVPLASRPIAQIEPAKRPLKALADELAAKKATAAKLASEISARQAKAAETSEEAAPASEPEGDPLGDEADQLRLTADLEGCATTEDVVDLSHRWDQDPEHSIPMSRIEELCGYKWRALDAQEKAAAREQKKKAKAEQTRAFDTNPNA